MRKQGEYHYDFSYSLALTGSMGPASQVTEVHSDEHDKEQNRELRQWLDKLPRTRNLLRAEHGAGVRFLCKLPSVTKMAYHLLGILRAQLQLGGKQKALQVQKHREDMLSTLQQLQSNLGVHKNDYILPVIVCLYLVLVKAAQEVLDAEVEEFRVFHIIYWELKGQLVSLQTMQGLLAGYCDMGLYRGYVAGGAGRSRNEPGRGGREEPGNGLRMSFGGLGRKGKENQPRGSNDRVGELAQSHLYRRKPHVIESLTKNQYTFSQGSKQELTFASRLARKQPSHHHYLHGQQ